jgi:hypothetical protein
MCPCSTREAALQEQLAASAQQAELQAAQAQQLAQELHATR